MSNIEGYVEGGVPPEAEGARILFTDRVRRGRIRSSADTGASRISLVDFVDDGPGGTFHGGCFTAN